jgi:hypothetical protein
LGRNRRVLEGALREAAMKLATIDCEFNGFGGELISMAVVIDGGPEFYHVKAIPENVDPWVRENVIPYLMKASCGPDFFKAALHFFLRNNAPLKIIADWPTDIAHLMQEMLGKTHDESISVEMELSIKNLNYQSRIPHNALEDARALLLEVLRS